MKRKLFDDLSQNLRSLPTGSSDYQPQGTSNTLLSLPGSMSFERDLEDSSSLRALSRPFQNMRRRMNFTDSGNVTFGSAANNTFSLKRDTIGKAWAEWCGRDQTCLRQQMANLVAANEKSPAFYLPGTLFFVLKMRELRQTKQAHLIPLMLINQAFHAWNTTRAVGNRQSHCICELCTAADGFDLAALGAQFQPVGVVMDDFDTESLADMGATHTSQRTYPHVFATDGEVPILNYWGKLALCDEARTQVQCKGSQRTVNLCQAAKLAVGETLFVGFSVENDRLFLTPVTGTTLECLFALDDKNKQAAFWSLGKVVDCVGGATRKFLMSGIPASRGSTDAPETRFEMPANPKLRESLFVTIALAKGLLLPSGIQS